jgi:DNA-binding transcriptional LysR family regulator
MDINAKQATALLAVLDTGSFEKAAERLHLTASAVSQRIRTLESQFGGPLVIRNRPCLPTATGMRLLQYLRRASQLEADFVADLPGPRLLAIERGLGYGMVPELQLGKVFTPNKLIDLAPQHPTDVALYWHSWDVQSPRMASLCKRIVETGRKSLRAL